MTAPRWTDVTFCGVYWNDPVRVSALLHAVRPWFSNLVVGVQTDDPENDATLAACRARADVVVTEPVAGHCEPTINKVLANVPTDWAFLVSADEEPSLNLLNAFQRILDHAAETKTDGYWIRMISSIEDIPYPSESDNHLRVFRKELGWPNTLHSRPPAKREFFWDPEDVLYHKRSLDEMMQDYLRYFRIGRGNPGWDAHNRLMMHDACEATARHYGWAFVSGFPWWPEVRDIAFGGQEQHDEGTN